MIYYKLLINNGGNQTSAQNFYAYYTMNTIV